LALKYGSLNCAMLRYLAGEERCSLLFAVWRHLSYAL